MSITVAVTNYNGLKHLQRLLPQLREHGFTDIVVLDDASSDGSLPYLQRQRDVRFVAGTSNLGPTGNRNRILSLTTGEIILFLDVDMELQGEKLARRLVAAFNDHPRAAVIGAQILSKSDEPMWYNWGYDASPKQDGLSEALNAVALAHWDDAVVMATVRKIAMGRIGHFEAPRERAVDWVSEAFFAVRADIFCAQKGFDEKFRMYHEGPDYCLRIREDGHQVWFVPTLRVKHLDLASGNSKQRGIDLRASTKYWYQKHYHVPDGIIERFFLW